MQIKCSKPHYIVYSYLTCNEIYKLEALVKQLNQDHPGSNHSRARLIREAIRSFLGCQD